MSTFLFFSLTFPIICLKSTIDKISNNAITVQKALRRDSFLCIFSNSPRYSYPFIREWNSFFMMPFSFIFLPFIAFSLLSDENNFCTCSKFYESRILFEELFGMCLYSYVACMIRICICVLLFLTKATKFIEKEIRRIKSFMMKHCAIFRCSLLRLLCFDLRAILKLITPNCPIQFSSQHKMFFTLRDEESIKKIKINYFKLWK